LRWINAVAAKAGQCRRMMWNRKQQPDQRYPARVTHELILSPAEQAARRTAAAAWPTGLAHLWLKRAPDTIMLPKKNYARRPGPCSRHE
jgi:hypothetical protein